MNRVVSLQGMHPRVIQPSLHEVRGSEHLLVWAEQGQWLMVDGEVVDLLAQFDGKTSLEEIKKRIAQGGDRGVEAQVDSVLKVMSQRGLMGSGSKAEAEPKETKISNVTLNITNDCNLRCSWCYNGRRRGKRVAASAVMDGLERGRDLLSPQCSLFVLGGEPMMVLPEVECVAERAEGLFSGRVLVSTNGTLVTADHARALSRCNVEVQVSVDSPLAEEHDHVRGQGNFDRALRGIRLLVRAGVPTILSMVYTAQSYRRMEAYLELAMALGVQEARFIPLRVVGMGREHRANIPDQAVVFEALLEIMERRKEFRRLLGRDYFSIAVKQCALSTRRDSCGVGRQVLFVDEDGSIYPCPNHVRPELRAGTVLRGGVSEVMQSRVMRRMSETYRVDRYDECRDCVVRRWCAGDCRGEVVAAGMAPTAAGLHCAELKKVYVRAMWLAARRDPRLALGAANHPSC